MPRKNKKDQFKSQFESVVAALLSALKIKWKYEPIRYKYVRDQSYTPDFVLANGVIIEAKGHFKSVDRTKHLLIQAQHPELDIRFVFQRDNPLRKGSITTYSDWCIKHNFLYAIGKVPESWVTKQK